MPLSVKKIHVSLIAENDINPLEKFVNQSFGAAANSEISELIVLAHFSITLIIFAKAYTGITLGYHAVGSFILCVQIKFKNPQK